jgi:D-xylose 1-dehydrogenase (NADP+, D-xylono-1,5-lactone-forming)
MIGIEAPRPPANAATDRFALWNLGFRLFYRVASAFAALSIFQCAGQLPSRSRRRYASSTECGRLAPTSRRSSYRAFAGPPRLRFTHFAIGRHCHGHGSTENPDNPADEWPHGLSRATSGFRLANTGASRMTSSSTRSLRIGIVGAANIARLFVDGVRPSRKVVVTAVASRDVEKARSFARETGIAQVHSTYEALLADPEIDAIYIPLPNNLHAEWSIRAVDAGKHVLCEKPLATSASEARAMFDAARRNGVYLVEGYPYRAQPQTLKLRELLEQEAIGRLQYIQASFGFLLGDSSNIRMNPALAGGALMDAGCYPVSLVRTIAGVRPGRVHSMARWSDSGVDLAMVASMEFAGGLLAQVSCSFATARHRHAFIAGDAGSIRTTYLNDTSAAFPPVLEMKRGTAWDTQQEWFENVATNGFLAEADSFHDLVMHGWNQWAGVSPQESIDIALTLEALAASARQGIAIEVAS